MMSFVFLNESSAKQIKEKMQSGEGVWEDVRFELRRRADACMLLGPWSVVYQKGKAKSGDIHDYYSEAPYWWPDPENPNGPYIRRDGEYYPDGFKNHREQMEKMSDAVLYLSLAGYYLNEVKYMERAVYILQTWFLNEETKMNPHLEYAQAIQGICDGRGIGIIDTNKLIQVIHAAGYISQLTAYEDTINGLKEWFGDYLHWMNTSEKGLEEKNHFNNHSNWWNAQVAAFAAFSGKETLLNECFDKYKNDILPNQLNSECAFEDELTRTRSYTYCLFNLEACAITCEIAYYQGVDLWHFQTPDQKSIEKAIDFMLPYIENPFLWKYEQIHGEGFSDKLALQLGALRLNRAEYEKINKLRRDNYRYIPSVNSLNPHASRLGPLVLMSGFSE